MSNKAMNFMAMSWFISVLICIVLEGSYIDSRQSSVLNQLIPITTLNIGGMVTLPALNLNFFQGFTRLLLWDYSFYYGGYSYIRWFWMVCLSPGAGWAIVQSFIWVYTSFIKPF
jgi:hypothetical protein